MDAAVWAVFQEGYHDGFGADADHLKTTGDIDRMVAAGFTMFTIDPGDHVDNHADEESISGLEQRQNDLPWDEIETNLSDTLERYAGKTVALGEGVSLTPDSEDVLRAVVKYGRALAHTVKMFRHLKETYPDHPSELEMSVDETETVTTPAEHFFFASELKRLGVQLVSFAPRFVGAFEKGIDFRGDLTRFSEEYKTHLLIARYLGGYKLSIHSGSDKFTVYRAIGELGLGEVHVKTAGTSYLEALRTVAGVEPDLFRRILEFSHGLYEHERRSYHVSAELARVPTAADLSDQQLLDLFDQDDARQVLHVTFGRVLTEKRDDGTLLFRDEIMKLLDLYEAQHYENLAAHFRRHVQPFALS